MPADEDDDNGFEEAMRRLAVLKAMPVDSLTDAQRKEKLCGPLGSAHLEGSRGVHAAVHALPTYLCVRRRLANRESARKMRRKQAVRACGHRASLSVSLATHAPNSSAGAAGGGGGRGGQAGAGDDRERG